MARTGGSRVQQHFVLAISDPRVIAPRVGSATDVVYRIEVVFRARRLVRIGRRGFRWLARSSDGTVRQDDQGCCQRQSDGFDSHRLARSLLRSHVSEADSCSSPATWCKQASASLNTVQVSLA